MTDTTDELTEKQAHVVSLLPASKHEIAEELGVSPNTAKGHVSAVREKGVAVEYDHEADVYFLNSDDNQKIRRISTKHKGTRTREANEWITEQERTILRRLKQKEPLKCAPREDPSSESFGAILSDLHFGDKVENEYGDVIHNTDQCEELVERFGEKCLRIHDLMSSRIDFDDAYLFILGDVATGNGIYEGQAYDLDATLADQVSTSVSVLKQLVESFAREFESVQVRCVLGNHGKIRASGVSSQANTDLLIYRWLHDRLIDSGHENVDVRIGEAKHYLNTQVRDWSFHLRHGHHGQQHVDKTSASSRDWRGWREKHRFDLGMRGHFHDPSIDYVMNQYPVITAPSPKPGSEFAEKIGQPDVSRQRQLGWAFGISDERPMTWNYLLDEQ